MRCLRLPFTFDAERLRADLDQVRPEDWNAHLNQRAYEGVWKGAPLRSIGGAMNNIIPDATDVTQFADTRLLARCAYFAEVVHTFGCPVMSARLLSLRAGSVIKEHVDGALDFEDGEVRIHVPVVTNDGVRFILDGERLVMAPGECWYTNVNLPHAVENMGTVDRVHLVIDCVVDDWLRELFAKAGDDPTPRHLARMVVPAEVDAGRLLQWMSDYVDQLAAKEGVGPALRARGTDISLSWADQPTWQIRLHPEGGDERIAGWRLETSADSMARHQPRVQRFCSAWQQAFPGSTVELLPAP